MNKLVPVDISRYVLDIGRDLVVSARERKPGLPVRIDGITMGIVTMEHDAPHGGEIHPDGDEILCVLSGKIRIRGDSTPEQPLVLGPGEACIVRKGEWHKVNILERTQLLYLTPGPNGEHRPL